MTTNSKVAVAENGVIWVTCELCEKRLFQVTEPCEIVGAEIKCPRCDSIVKIKVKL